MMEIMIQMLVLLIIIITIIFIFNHHFLPLLAYQSLVDKYGFEESSSSPTKKRKTNKNKDNDDNNDNNDNDNDNNEKPKKLNKTEIFVNYDNQPVHDQLLGITIIIIIKN